MKTGKTMKKHTFIICVCLLMAISCVYSPLWADGQEVSVNFFPSFASGSENGYDVYSFKLENNTSQKQVVDIVVSVDNNYSDLEVTKQVELVGNENRIEKIFFPVFDSSYKGTAHFYLKGKEFDSINLAKSSSGYRGYYAKSILVDKSLTVNDTDKVFKDPGLDYSLRNDFHLCYFESNLDMMDRDWFAYYQYAALIFYDDTFERMPDLVQSAIIDYVKAGGNLVILGHITPPSDFWGGRYKSVKYKVTSGVRNIYSVGLGSIFVCNKDLFKEVRSTPPSSSSSSYGYGSRKDKKEEKKDDTQNIKGTYVPSDILREFDISRRKSDTIKVEDCFNSEYKAMTSVFLILLLVFVFAILIGPLNFVYLNYYDKKILIFVTVPVTSLICCSIVFLYFLFFEYGRLDVYRQSFTLLDENTNTSITYGGESIVSGKAINDALSFPLTSIVKTSTGGRSRNITGLRTISLGKSQVFGSNWIKAKTPSHYTVVSIKQDRSRVEINSSGSEVEILNGLGADISLIYYKSVDGKSFYEGKDIRAGDRRKLSSAGSIKRSSDKEIDYDILFKSYRKVSDIKSASRTFAERELRPGEYFVYLKTDPFLKQSFDRKASIREMGCFVYGKPKKGGA